MRYAKLITAGFLILTFYFLNNFQKELSLKVNNLTQNKANVFLTALSVLPSEAAEAEKEPCQLIRAVPKCPTPQASFTTSVDEAICVLISNVRTSFL